MTNLAVTDVATRTFDTDVIEASRERPVVVDFWAPWCGPCRALGPLLERMAGAAEGAWTLVKINVDNNQELGVRYGVQGIPAVKGFRDGRLVAEFVGAQPEPMVRRFLDRLLPSPADEAAAMGDRLASDGDTVAAEAAYRQALELRSDHPRATLGLGRLLEAVGRADEALELLATLPPKTQEGREAGPLLARLRLQGDAGADASAALAEAEATLRRDPRDPAANLRVGQTLAAREAYDEALPRLLAVVEKDKGFRDGAARTAMLAIFDLLGPDHPLTIEYRRKLASALYV